MKFHKSKEGKARMHKLPFHNMTSSLFWNSQTKTKRRELVYWEYVICVNAHKERSHKKMLPVFSHISIHASQVCLERCSSPFGNH